MFPAFYYGKIKNKICDGFSFDFILISPLLNFLCRESKFNEKSLENEEFNFIPI